MQKEIEGNMPRDCEQAMMKQVLGCQRTGRALLSPNSTGCSALFQRSVHLLYASNLSIKTTKHVPAALGARAIAVLR